MNHEPLDPADVMILFADLQAGIIERSVTVPEARLRVTTSGLAKLARLLEIPAVVTAAPGPEGAPQIVPEIAAALGPLPAHVRTTTDAFSPGSTRDALMAHARKTLLIAGVASEIIVQHSALSGVARGLHVQVVVDACGGISARTERAAFDRMIAAGVVLTSFASVAGQLSGDLTSATGGQVLDILYASF